MLSGWDVGWDEASDEAYDQAVHTGGVQWKPALHTASVLSVLPPSNLTRISLALPPVPARRFDRGTLYCSPPTALLVQQQLRVKPGCIRCGLPMGMHAGVGQGSTQRRLAVERDHDDNGLPICPPLFPTSHCHSMLPAVASVWFCSTVKLNSPIVVEGVRVTFLVCARHSSTAAAAHNENAHQACCSSS